MKLFSQPYAFESSARRKSLRAVAFGAFVFLFLFVFKPFGISGDGWPLVRFMLGFGAITSGAMLLLNVAAPLIFPRFFNEDGWTTGREIVSLMLNVTTIGVLNYLYTVSATNLPGGWMNLLWFIGITFVIGLFPISILVLMKERRERTGYESSSAQLTAELHPAQPNAHPRSEEKTITISSANVGDDDLVIAESALRFIRSADNYAEVHYRVDRRLERRIVRATLKEISDRLADRPALYRCHKSYLVNMEAVERISGNAQGYKLHLEGVELPVPVSRSNNETIRTHLPVRP
jgi:hypothetical protein